MDFIFKVDPIRRNIKVPDAFTVLTMDHNIHKLVFVCPYYEDFAFDSASIVFMIDAPDGRQYSIPAEEYESFPNSPSPYVKFTLTLKSYITSVVGYMSFCITADIISSGNVIEKSWHSKNITISIGGHIDNDDSEDIPEEDVPTINQRLNNLDSKVGRLQTTVNGMANGSPAPVATVAEMTDESTVYLYTGSETGYTAGDWYYYDGAAWTSGGTYGGAVTDTTLTIEGTAADAKSVGQAFFTALMRLEDDENLISGLDTRVTALESGSSGGLTADVKTALLACFRGLAWKGDADPVTLYQALDLALNPPADLLSISCVYTQSGAVDIADSLETLRPDLTVTAHYTGGTSEVVTAYNLSGTLAVGTSTITVSYGGKTATFDVTVTSSWMYIWDLTDNLTDKVSGRTAVASAGTGVDAPAITSEGLAFTAATQMVSFGDIDLAGKTIEIDVASMDFKGDTNAHIRFLCSGGNSVGYGPIVYHKTDGWSGYQFSAQTGGSAGWIGSWVSEKNRNLFSGKTVKLVSGSDGSASLYLDGELLKTRTNVWYHAPYNLCIGGLPSYSQSSGDQCYDMVISAVRIKETEVA